MYANVNHIRQMVASMVLLMVLSRECWPAAASSTGSLQSANEPASGWACITSSPDVQVTFYYAIRLTATWHVECSRNAKVDYDTYKNDECANFYSMDDCHAYIQGNMPDVGTPDKLQTLVCGKHHESLWGSPGYGDPTHWCERGFKLLRPKAFLYPSCTCNNPMTAQKYRSVCASEQLRGPVCDCFCTLAYLVGSLEKLNTVVKEVSLHITAWELFRHWYQVAAGHSLQLDVTPGGQEHPNTQTQELRDAIAEMVALAQKYNVSGWQRRGRLLLQKSLGYVWDLPHVGPITPLGPPALLDPNLLLQDLSGGPSTPRVSTQCKSIAKKYKFSGLEFKPAPLCTPRTPVPKDYGTMYLTITPDCKVKVENIFVDPSGKTQIIQGGTQELFPGIAEVPCFGVHWSYLGSGMVNDHFYEIDSRGEMRQYSVDSTCSHDCLPPGCVLHWKTTDWPDCSWAMKTYQAQSAVRAAFDEAGGIPGRIASKLAAAFNFGQSIMEDILKKMRDNQYKDKRQATYDAFKGSTTTNTPEKHNTQKNTNTPKKLFTAKDGIRILKKRGYQAVNGDDVAGAWQSDMSDVVSDIVQGWNKLNPVDMWTTVRKVLTWPQCWGFCWDKAPQDDIAAWARIPDCIAACVNTAKFVP